jgi:threonine dehydratase
MGEEHTMTTGKATPSGMTPTWNPLPIEAIQEAQRRTAGVVVRTPLVRLDADAGEPAIHLKLECLQPIRAFKLRGAYNAMAKAGRDALAEGVWTASAGNMAQGVAWAARALGIHATVYVPNTAPQTKIAAVRRYGGTVIEIPPDDWVEIFRTRRRQDAPGIMVHPYSDPDVMAGNGVIGLEILEDLPEVEAVIVPWGGGGLCSGIASAIKALRPQTRVYASEVDTGAPLAASLAAGMPVEVPWTPSFVDGISGPFINREMFDLAQRLVDGAIVVSREQTAKAARLIMERNRVIPEGAAATSVAAALTGQAGTGPIACLISGGNIDTRTLVTILEGGTPT